MKQEDLQQWDLDIDKGILVINSTAVMSSAPWYPFRAIVKQVVISAGVTSIGDSAFEDYTALLSVAIPKSVTSIGNSAFEGCSSLSSVIIPESVKSIGNTAFGGCCSLLSVTIPEGVTSIGDAAFGSCTSLFSDRKSTRLNSSHT